MKKLLMIILLSNIGIGGIAFAQKPVLIISDRPGWQKIAETSVDFQKERQDIIVLGADRFATIIFRVDDAPIYLTSLDVYYESGDIQNITINMPIKLKGESRSIDLNGGERSLKKIVFVYKTLPNRNDVKARVEIWGLKTNTDTK